MGTDIHVIVQTRRDAGDWETEDVEVWDDRSYNTFSILANVRNGYGFAGVVTGDGYKPIAEPRGLPAGVKNSEDYDDPNRLWLGDHSFSWLVLKELLDYDWDQTTFSQGVVDARQYQVFKATGQPNSWCGDMSGPGIVKVSNQEMDEKIFTEVDSGPSMTTHDDLLMVSNPGVQSQATQYITTVRWPVVYRDAARGFLSWVDRVLAPLGDQHGVENVRMVFGFDS